jgi:hypothetical protein
MGIHSMLSILILAGTAFSVAQTGSSQSAGPHETWEASAGDLHAMMVFTDDPEAFLNEWSTPPDSTPRISSVDSAHRGDTVVAFVFFTGCKPIKGRCDSEADFKLLRPDGSVYAEQAGVELWKDKPPPPLGNLQLSVANLGFRVELVDPLGNYHLKVVVRDLNAKLDLSLEREIEVLPAR